MTVRLTHAKHDSTIKAHTFVTGEFSILYGACTKGWLDGVAMLLTGACYATKKSESKVNKIFCESQNLWVKVVLILI